MTNREKLKEFVATSSYDEVVDFIIADRKRIVDLLVDENAISLCKCSSCSKIRDNLKNLNS